jgi:hypothetical protein
MLSAHWQLGARGGQNFEQTDYRAQPLDFKNFNNLFAYSENVEQRATVRKFFLAYHRYT